MIVAQSQQMTLISRSVCMFVLCLVWGRWLLIRVYSVVEPPGLPG
jgi:hypothetical protein